MLSGTFCLIIVVHIWYTCNTEREMESRVCELRCYHKMQKKLTTLQIFFFSFNSLIIWLDTKFSYCGHWNLVNAQIETKKNPVKCHWFSYHRKFLGKLKTNFYYFLSSKKHFWQFTVYYNNFNEKRSIVLRRGFVELANPICCYLFREDMLQIRKYH